MATLYSPTLYGLVEIVWDCYWVRFSDRMTAAKDYCIKPIALGTNSFFTHIFVFFVFESGLIFFLF